MFCHSLSGPANGHALPGRVGSSEDSSPDAEAKAKPKPKGRPKSKGKAAKNKPVPDDTHDPIHDESDEDGDHPPPSASDVDNGLGGSKTGQSSKRPASAKGSSKKPAQKHRKHGGEDPKICLVVCLHFALG